MSKGIINGYEQPRTANIFSDGFGCSEDYADGEGDGSAINDATDGFGDGFGWHAFGDGETNFGNGDGNSQTQYGNGQSSGYDLHARGDNA